MRQKNEATKLNKKVALVGSASSTKDQAPFQDLEFDIWCLAWRTDAPRCTRSFDMHPINPMRKKVPPNYPEFLSQKGHPVYLTEARPDIPNGIRYPIEEVIEFLSKFDPLNSSGDYFASSISYMFALAMFEKYEEIHLYGIDLIDDDEWAFQRPNTEYLIGLARGLGHKVYIPKASALTKFTYRYGYETDVEIGIINKSMLEGRIAQYKQRMEKAMAEAHTCDGAIQEATALMSVLKHHTRGSKINGD